MSDPWAEFRVQSAAPAAGADPWAEFRRPAPAPEAPSRFRRLGVGVRDAAVGLASVADIPANALAAVGNAPFVAWDAMRGNEAGASEPFRYGAATRLAESGADAVGLPRAATDGERLTSSAVRGAAATIPMIAAGGVPAVGRAAPLVAQALSSAPISQMVGGATSGVAGFAAQEAGAGPIGTMAAGLAGGVGGAAATSLAAGAARGAQAMGTPFFQSGRERIVGDTLLRFSDNPMTLADRLNARVGAEPAVPGSMPTTAEGVRDVGLSGLQRTLQAGDPQMANALAQRAEVRDAARVGLLDRVTPDTGGAPLVGAAARREQVLLQAETARAEAAARARLQQEQGLLPAPITAEEAGGVIRGLLSEGQQAAAARTSAAYQAVDPEGTARIPLDGLRATADRLAAERFTPLGGRPSAGLGSVFDDLRAAGPETSWRDIQGLRSRLGAIAGDPATPPNERSIAGQMLAELERTLDTAALPRELPTVPRTDADIAAQGAAEGMAQRPNIDRDLMGATGTQRAAAARDEKSLLQAIVEAGGIYDPGGDVAQMSGRGAARPGLFRTERTRRSMTGVRQPGEPMTLDEAADFARQRGYFPEHDATYGVGDVDGFRNADLLNAMDDELRAGQPRYAGGSPVRDAVNEADAVARELRRTLGERGGSGFERGPEAAAILRDQTDTPAGMDRPEPVYVPQNPFTPEQAAAYREAQFLRREQGRLYDDGQPGQVLRERYGRPVVPDSGVPGRFFRAGPGAPETLRALNEAAPGATDAVRRYAAESLRTAAVGRDGTVNPQALAQWRARHADALRELPDLDRATQSVQQAADMLETTRTQGAARVDDFNNGPARFFLDRDPGRAMAGLLSQPDAAKQVQAMAAMVARDPAAKNGLRRAFVEEMQRAAQAQTEHAGGMRRMTAAGAGRFWDRTQEAARGLFTPEEIAQLQSVVSDLRSAAFPDNAGRAVGSNTVQNLAAGNILSRMTNGVVDGTGGGVTGQAMRLVRRLYTAPEALIQQQLQQAAMEPAAALRAVQSAERPGLLTPYLNTGPSAGGLLAQRLAGRRADEGDMMQQAFAGLLARRLTNLQPVREDRPR